MTRSFVAVVLVVPVGVGAATYYANRHDAVPEVTTVPASVGSVVSAVSATGTLQAVTTVQVGTQVSGTIAWLGADFNSIVRKGQVIAKLDPSLLDAQVQQAQATRARAEADARSAAVHLDDARQQFARSSELASKQLLARSDFDAARVAVDTAVAQVKSAEAQLVQARASLEQALVNRQHATIAAPIDGIVIQRTVDVGQTVAASLQSPTIFEIAADLADMQVNASIDESDIGRIAEGQPVTFTVDAYPGETFAGTTTQVRLQPTVVQDVTTYSAIISVPNPDLKLRPGMTATVSVEVARRDDVVRVPNIALRFTPTPEVLAALGADETRAPGQGSTAKVWTYRDGRLTAVPVEAGLSDATMTEIAAGSLAPDTPVVTGVRLEG